MITAASWLRRPDARWLLGVRLAGTEPSWSATRSLMPRPRTVALVATAAFVLVLPGGVPQFGVVVGGLAVAFGLALQDASRHRRRARAFKADSGRFLRSLAAELHAGVAPMDAAQAAARECGHGGSDQVWAPVRHAGPDEIADAIASVAQQPGGEGLADATAAWRLADRTGAPLAAILGRVSDAVHSDVDVERAAAVEAAPARATARLMAMLPIAGVALGLLMGVDPLGILFGTVPGVLCLAGGVGLSCAGLWWIERLVVAAES